MVLIPPPDIYNKSMQAFNLNVTIVTDRQIRLYDWTCLKFVIVMCLYEIVGRVGLL
jgi:hypothetical protein